MLYASGKYHYRSKSPISSSRVVWSCRRPCSLPFSRTFPLPISLPLRPPFYHFARRSLCPVVFSASFLNFSAIFSISLFFVFNPSGIWRSLLFPVTANCSCGYDVWYQEWSCSEVWRLGRWRCESIRDTADEPGCAELELWEDVSVKANGAEPG